MYTPGMSVMTLLLKNRYESKRSIDFIVEKETDFAFFSLFLKRISASSGSSQPRGERLKEDKVL
jgi:hypothetical protein